jgi:hypothetical protein
MPAVRLVASLFLFALVGCTHNIGDPCTANVDCSPQGDRFCDLSAPNGYCTVDGCDVDTCPGNSVCIRFFLSVPNRPCNPDVSVNPPENGCNVSEFCVCDSSVQITGADQPLCRGNMGHCAPESSERRWCQARCSSDSDCRDGYECRTTGTNGAEPVPDPDMGSVVARFCAPRG